MSGEIQFNGNSKCSVKFTMHKTTITKKILIKKKSKKADLSGPKAPKLVRISYTDLYATDSSSDEANELYPQQRVKKYVNEITFERCKRGESLRKKAKAKEVVDGEAMGGGWKKYPAATAGGERKFQGVRLWSWGRWVAEIRSPGSKRIWLGTFNTVEEAAQVYDEAAIRIHGPDAQANLITPPRKESLPEVCASNFVSAFSAYETGEETNYHRWSPTSVIQCKITEAMQIVVEPADELDRGVEPVQTDINEQVVFQPGLPIDPVQPSENELDQTGENEAIGDDVPMDIHYLNDFFNFELPDQTLDEENLDDLPMIDDLSELFTDDVAADLGLPESMLQFDDFIQDSEFFGSDPSMGF